MGAAHCAVSRAEHPGIRILAQGLGQRLQRACPAMECPHISDAVKIDRSCVRNKIKLELNAGATVGASARTVDDQDPHKRSSPDSTTKPTPDSRLWKCLECASDKENWMCLNCGKVLCGRYVNGHALKHSAEETDHQICMNTLNQSVFCYRCDDFVINETAQLQALRKELQVGAGDEEPETTSSSASSTSSTSAASNQQSVEATSSSNSKSSRQSSSSSGADSGWVDDVHLLPQSLGRRLRPRKRTISSDSNQEAGKEVSSTVSNSSAAAAANATTTSSTPAKRTKSAATKRVVGLRNLGNTCFMNSVLQSLSNIQEFSSYFCTLPSMEQIKQQRKKAASSGGYVSSTASSSSSSSSSFAGGLNGGSCLSSRELEDANVVEELRKVLLNLGQGGDGSKAISPECLFLVIWKVVPQFRGHRQHDAHEFLRYMLDRLHTELQQNAFPPVAGGKSSSLTQGTSNGGGPANGAEAAGQGGARRSSIVTNVFGGVLQSEVRCLICGMDSKKHDPFLDLSLDIPEKFYSKEAATAAATTTNGGGEGAAGREEKPACHIWDCLSSFTEVEELAETELYYCNSCKCKQKSTKRFWIRRLPNVLCLHIKRFRWSNFFRTKIDLRISFPIKSLDMSQFVLNNGPETRRSNSSNNVYDLAAVIVHHGNGSSCGHYTSYAYHNGAWLHFNDHTVKEVPYSQVADCKPYILFYTRRDANSKSGSPSSSSSSGAS